MPNVQSQSLLTVSQSITLYRFLCAARLLASHLRRARPIRHPPLAAPLPPRQTAAPHQPHPRTAQARGRPLLQEADQVGACNLISDCSGMGQQHPRLLWSTLHSLQVTVPAHLQKEQMYPPSWSLVADGTSQMSLGHDDTAPMSIQVQVQAPQEPLHLALALPKPAVAALLPKQSCQAALGQLRPILRSLATRLAMLRSTQACSTPRNASLGC